MQGAKVVPASHEARFALGVSPQLGRLCCKDGKTQQEALGDTFHATLEYCWLLGERQGCSGRAGGLTLKPVPWLLGV